MRVLYAHVRVRVVCVDVHDVRARVRTSSCSWHNLYMYLSVCLSVDFPSFPLSLYPSFLLLTDDECAEKTWIWLYVLLVKILKRLKT